MPIPPSSFSQSLFWGEPFELSGIKNGSDGEEQSND